MSKSRKQVADQTRPKVLIYERISKHGSIIYRPKWIPKPLTLIERLRIARAKVHAEQAKQAKQN